MNKNIKYPENKKIREKLQRGDIAKIAEYSGMSAFTVIQTLKGARRMSDNIAKAIIRLASERKQLEESLMEISNTL